MTDPSLLSNEDILMQRRSLRRELSAQEGLREVRLAVLGGSTTNQLVDLLEVMLLGSGFRPVFHQGEYGRFFEEAVLETETLAAFQPDIVYLHTSCYDIRNRPSAGAGEAEVRALLRAEMERFRSIWDSLETLGCQIIQNNFELPSEAILGSLDAVTPGGFSRFVLQLNEAFAAESAVRRKLLIHDEHGLSARIGLRNWFDWDRYFSYKLLLQPMAQVELARSLSALIRALYGKSRKVLVLDLDNTLWGGVIGDDGADKILIGKETPEAEAYTAFQQFCLRLRERGVLLAVCSKNNEDTAKSGFAHPDSVLKLEHISAFRANWEPKHENIRAIAEELNLGLDSFVFVDDNPAERAIVQAQLPAVAVPEVGSEVSKFVAIIQSARFFEPVSLSQEDLARAAKYAENSLRQEQAAKFANYGEYLDSLEMTAEIETFKPVYLDRIAQLTNKSNQFNLTTRRYTLAEVEALAEDPTAIPLYGRLADRFGDNGLISVVIGRVRQRELDIDLWLMSCRVLKRDMELAMLDALVDHAQRAGVTCLCGFYLPTAKNSMVAGHYAKLGFTPVDAPAHLPPGSTAWTLDITGYTPRNTHIKILEFPNA
jgi:FkbH-like protein